MKQKTKKKIHIPRETVPMYVCLSCKLCRLSPKRKSLACKSKMMKIK